MNAKAFAPAKVNLTLHVTGQRGDGYHLLDSLVVFADVGDRLQVVPALNWSLSVTGPMAAGVPFDDRNLVLRAAHFAKGAPCAITLEKHLPMASGVGGGSSDAAACLRALHALDGRALPCDVTPLGADLPVCLRATPSRMSGIGEVLGDMPPLPEIHAVLVNPGVAVSTPAVFRAMRARDNAPMPVRLPVWRGVSDFAKWLATQRNDMEPAAREIAPEIGHILARIAATTGCLLARMSGSGATCFGIYADSETAAQGAKRLRAELPAAWVKATQLGAPAL